MKLDNIIFDVKPHEVDEAVSLLEKWGGRLLFNYAAANNLPPKCVRMLGGDIFVSYLDTAAHSNYWFHATLDELRIVTAELKA